MMGLFVVFAATFAGDVKSTGGFMFVFNFTNCRGFFVHLILASFGGQDAAPVLQIRNRLKQYSA